MDQMQQYPTNLVSRLDIVVNKSRTYPVAFPPTVTSLVFVQRFRILFWQLCGEYCESISLVHLLYLDHVVGISKDEGEVGLAADHPDGELGALVVGAHLAGLFTPGVL